MANKLEWSIVEDNGGGIFSIVYLDGICYGGWGDYARMAPLQLFFDIVNFERGRVPAIASENHYPAHDILPLLSANPAHAKTVACGWVTVDDIGETHFIPESMGVQASLVFGADDHKLAMFKIVDQDWGEPGVVDTFPGLATAWLAGGLAAWDNFFVDQTGDCWTIRDKTGKIIAERIAD